MVRLPLFGLCRFLGLRVAAPVVLVLSSCSYGPGVALLPDLPPGSLPAASGRPWLELAFWAVQGVLAAGGEKWWLGGMN